MAKPKVKDPAAQQAELTAARDEFIAQWGIMGSSWGINRTMAQIHALLMVSTTPLSTDEIMAELAISRGNAHMNLRDLVGWGLVRSVIRKGERKEFFEAEKDVWKIFCTVVRERKRREIEGCELIEEGRKDWIFDGNLVTRAGMVAQKTLDGVEAAARHGNRTACDAIGLELGAGEGHE